MKKQDLTITVQGWSYDSMFNDDICEYEEDKKKIIFQTISINKNGMIEKTNIECSNLLNPLSEKKLMDMLDKKVIFKNAKMINNLYVAKSFKILESKTE